MRAKVARPMNTLRSTNAQRAGARLLAVVLLAVVLLAAGCATPPPPAPPTPVPLLHDKLFPGAVRPPAADDLFTLSAEMEAYANRHLLSLLRQSDPRQALVDTMYLKGGLQLSYDASRTRTAAEAFAARQGNCLSLVIMTAAFAQWLGLPVSFQSVLVEETYSRNGDLTLASQHVNLVIGPPPLRPGVGRGTEDTLVVDFLPAADIRGQRGRPLERRTIVAMFFNNRAAEALVDGQLDQAYWLAREALLHDPGYVNAANTLGVIYARAGHDGAAEAALRHVLASDATAINALSNLLPLLQRTQRGGEAAAVAARPAAL
jgi:regulator of sirC expression with transglutaminase-like and TPR domain